MGHEPDPRTIVRGVSVYPTSWIPVRGEGHGADRGFSSNAEVGSHLPSIVNAETPAIEAEVTTPQQLTHAGQECSTGAPDRARVSVGMEYIDDMAGSGWPFATLCSPNAV